MAKIDVIMPQMGESIAEGTLSRWMKKVGDAVKRDEPIFEISTDKVDAEIPAPAAGVLAEILVTEGQTVAVQTVVAKIETEAGAVAAPEAPAPAEAPAATAPAARATAPSASAPARATPPSAPSAPALRCVAPAGARARSGPESHAAGSRRERRRERRGATPAPIDSARAEDGGGAQSRSQRDPGLRARRPRHQERHPELPRDRTRARRRSAGRRRRGAQPPAPAVPGTPPAAPAHAPSVEPWPGDRVEPWSRIRKLTAEHMVMSRRVSPHVNTIFEIDYTRIAQLRGKKKKEYADRGVNLTYLAFIAKAVADALRQHPTVNAAVSGESTVLRRDINLGIAVALDWGLIVPVIKHADELSLLGVARAINDLGERARTKKLSPDDVQRGTFTITNPGVFGSVIGTPIINQPQAAILCVGTIEKQPAVITVDGTDTLAVRTKGMLSLAFDHRIVDGADADRFMADVKAIIAGIPRRRGVRCALPRAHRLAGEGA